MIEGNKAFKWNLALPLFIYLFLQKNIWALAIISKLPALLTLTP